MNILEGKTIAGDLTIDAEVVVVGSGAGGAVVAKELAEAGIDVVVLEEGPYVPDEVYQRYRPTETLRYIGREAGTTAVLGLGDTPIITVMAGRAIGGSSILTGGVCFRIPEIVHQRWVHERGLELLTARNMEPAFESAERETRVETVPESMRSLATQRFADGATKLGIPVKPFRRNTDGCVGHGRCNFGCPAGAKYSVDRSYLPKAIAAGARVYSDCLVERVLTSGSRAVGVAGRLLGERDAHGQSKRGRFLVSAKTVVIAAGTIHSPLLLLRSGLQSPALGRHLTLHPGFRIAARFAEPVYGWKGALQSAYSDHFEAEGITLTGLFVPPNVLAAGLPGIGPTFAERVSQVPHLGIFGGIVHDEDGGRVRRGIGREPLITYRLAPKDKAAMIRGIQILAEIFLAAGAVEMYPPVFGMEPLRDPGEVKQRITGQISARRMECVTFHPLGTCRIANDPDEGVVDSWGKCFELEELYVADGSVFPSSIGVNSQLPIMAMATRIAWGLRDRLRDRVRGSRAAAPLEAAR
ncbi:MAG: GMC family oxidoreductase [Deltaproteobacteria bacterium]|nr:GMC family oxidoreductase [Deltaproteobacteria bacterium]